MSMVMYKCFNISPSLISCGFLYLTVFVSLRSCILNLFVLSAQGVLEGKYDDLPEQAFYMVGGVEEVAQKAEKMAKDMQ